MGGETWSLTAKLCDSCKTTSATIFCRADSAFLCLGCDSKIHAANKLASRHARVWMCEVCEQAPATVTCKADAAALCPTCDRDIHAANPLARRHERAPVVPFYDSATAAAKPHGGGGGAVAGAGAGGDESGKYVNDIDINENDVAAEEEAEAASWLLPLPNATNPKGVEYLFNDLDPYLDMDLLSGERKPQVVHQQQYHQSSDGVVPVQNKNEDRQTTTQFFGPVVDGYPTFEIDCSPHGSKPFMYNFTSQSISQSISSSSLDVGVVPDQMVDVSTGYPPRSEAVLPSPITGVDREARVMRYREKRKNRKFEKTIRYASRKAYAETRPRIKGRFAKRTDQGGDVESLINIGDTSTYSVVPSY